MPTSVGPSDKEYKVKISIVEISSKPIKISEYPDKFGTERRDSEVLNMKFSAPTAEVIEFHIQRVLEIIKEF